MICLKHLDNHHFDKQNTWGHPARNQDIVQNQSLHQTQMAAYPFYQDQCQARRVSDKTYIRLAHHA